MKRIIIYLLLLTICSVSCKQDKKSELAKEQDKSEKAICKLPRIIEGDISLGFPKVEGLAPSLGKVNMTVLFTDFNDVPAETSTDSVFSIINPLAPNFFEEVSYGKMELNLQPHFEWLRLSKPSEYYGTAIYRGQPHLDFIQEAVDLANEKVDFSETDIVLVINNPLAKALRQGPTFKSSNPEYHIKADGASIPTGITSGYDLNYWGGIWLPHETGHTFGLPDLYHFGSEKLNRYVGTFGLMGTCDAKAPGYFAYERWILGWLEDSQIHCLANGEQTIEIEALETLGGTKAVVVPIDSTRVLTIESRRKIGFDKDLSKEGVLVYVVNTELPGGSGPIQVKPGMKSNDEFLEDAPLTKEETYTFENVIVKVVESNKESDKVKVIVNK
ncbi:hypothetical protein [Winogradskyella sp.]|uniref:hypothetical protein n=1 Tax=Winogradskyella sp. TaxID=1883156 RepID=UPI002633B8F0|nr:hypothetical protein [Winogradskyella sp.]